MDTYTPEIYAEQQVEGVQVVCAFKLNVTVCGEPANQLTENLIWANHVTGIF